MTVRAGATSLALLLALLAPAARAEEALPPEAQGISIEERPGAQLPEELVLRNQRGESVTLGSYLHDGKPLLLVLAYYECPMLCTLVLNGLTEGMKGVAWNAGEGYRALVVSIDPRDTVELAAKKREHHLRAYGRPVQGNGWDFLTGDAASVRRLADAVGFHYRWDEAGKQFVHAAGAFVVTPEGKLSRTLYGVIFKPETLRLALLEASQGKLGGAWDKVLLLCFHYDPNARGYVLAATRLMRAGGLLTLLALGALLLALTRRAHHPRTAERTS